MIIKDVLLVIIMFIGFYCSRQRMFFYRGVKHVPLVFVLQPVVLYISPMLFNLYMDESLTFNFLSIGGFIYVGTYYLIIIII